MNAQDKAVADYLKEQGVIFNAVCRGEVKRDEWLCDKWDITFSIRGNTMETDYYTGTGHRKATQPVPDHVKRNPRSIAAHDWLKAYMKPQTPTAASVLYSLLSDAQGSEQAFDYWCGDYGFDSDSIKAFNIYNACCAIRHKLYALFNPEQRQKLNQLLEDY